MLKAAHPGDESLDTHAKAGMWHGTKAAQVEIPVEGLARELVFVETFFEKRQIVNPLAAANDFAITFGSDDIDAESDFGAVRIGLKVKCFNFGGVTIDDDGAIEAAG